MKTLMLEGRGGVEANKGAMKLQTLVYSQTRAPMSCGLFDNIDCV